MDLLNFEENESYQKRLAELGEKNTADKENAQIINKVIKWNKWKKHVEGWRPKNMR